MPTTLIPSLRTRASELETARLVELFPNSDGNAYTARIAAYASVSRMTDAEVLDYLTECD